MSKKRGQLSLEEEKFIKDNIDSLTIEQMATHLNRNESPVKRYIIENQLYINDDTKNEYLSLIHI